MYSRDDGDGGPSSKAAAIDAEDESDVYDGKRVSASTADTAPSDNTSITGEDSPSEPSNVDENSCDESEVLSPMSPAMPEDDSDSDSNF